MVAVAKAVPSRAAKPVLHNVRIGDGLVSGTDLELRIDATIGEHCEPFLVPYDRLSQIVRAASGDTVKFTCKGDTVTVKCGGGSWTLPTESVDEFPLWEPANLTAVCRLPADQFARAAKATTYATDVESSRYALGAVLLEVKGGDPTWVATDGRRLACQRLCATGILQFLSRKRYRLRYGSGNSPHCDPKERTGLVAGRIYPHRSDCGAPGP